MQSRNYAVMLIVMIALSGASVAATGVQTSPVQNVESQNVIMVAEVSVNATPTVSNSKQRRQYRLSYVSWKNRVFGRKLAYGLNWARGIGSSAAYAAVRKWLELGEIVNAIDTSIKSSKPVPRHIARDSMTIQDAWWDLDETMDSDLHRDSIDLSGNYDEVGCGCGFIYDQFKDFMVSDLRYCICCGSEFVLPDARDSQTTMQIVVGCPSGSTVDFTRIFTVNADGDKEDMFYLVSEIQDLIEARVSAWNNPRETANTATLPSVARDSADSDSHTIDLTPSPSAYARMLEVVIKDSTNAADVEWATAELNKMKKQKRMSQFNRDGSMDLTISCNCGCGYTTRLEGQFPMPLGVESYYCSWIPEEFEEARDSAWDDEKLSYAIKLLSEKDLVKYQEWVYSQDGEWNDDGTISFANANAKLDYDMRQLRYNKLQSDMGYCRETELLLCNLERHGFTLVGHRPSGYDLIKFNRTIDDEGNMPSNHYDIQNIIYDCWNHEETTLIVNHPSRGDREIGIRLVYGNEFGVLAADYSAPKDWLADPEWYVALRSAANTDIDSIEYYEAITGSSMEYQWNDNLGRVSGKITFDDMMEDGYKYKLCPKCLESGHENNESYCHRYGASLSNGDTGSCIGYPSEEIARDSKKMKYTHYVQNESHLGIDKIEGNTKDELIAALFNHIAMTSGYHEISEKDAVKSIIEDEDGNEHPNWQVWMREHTHCPDCMTSWIAISEGGSSNCICDARDSADERMTLSGKEAIIYDHYVVGNIIAKMTKKELIDELLGCFGLDDCLENGYVVQIADSARDSAEMAVLIPSRFDGNVSDRELHPNVSLLNPDGFSWSDEQLHILNDFAWWFQEYQDGTKTSRPRMVIESVAGSGKTTLVKELLSIINRFDSATKTIASAFNVHIAKILKDEIKDQQKNGFRGLETLGNSNSVSAGGYDIIRSHLKAQGITNVGMESNVEGKYLVLSKIILAEYFAMISKPDGVKNANVGEVIRIMKDVCEFSQAAKPNYRNQYMKLARDLKKIVEALMGQGFVPTRSESKDLIEIKRIYGQIALVQGLNDTVLLKLPKNAMFTLARDVLLRSMDTWNSQKEVFPFAWTKNYSFSDVIVARTEGFAESGNFEKARFDSNNLYPLWKTLTRDVWDNDKLKTNMLFDHLSKAGLIWPPRSKESGKPTVSAPSGKPACEVWVKGNQMSVSFRDGLAASSKIDGSRACDFLKYNGIISQWPRNNLNAGKYNESIVKKLETKFKSAKGGFKLHGDSSADIVIEESRSKITVSFSDHTWLPIALNLEPSADVKKDFGMIDEIQDLSTAKGSLIRKLIRNDGDSGLVLVGDRRQSIMGWSGASPTAMIDNAAASNCVSYPMTICWRGSHEVAHSANRVMSNVLETVQGLWPQTDFPDYLSHKSPSIETWPVGKPMESIGTDMLVSRVKRIHQENPDAEIAVLSRVNQPLGAVILDLVSNGISITTPSGKDGIVNSIKPILTNKYVEPKSPSQGIGIDLDNTNFKDLRSVRNRLEQVVSWAFNQSMIRNKGDADAASKDEKYTSIEGNAELAEALIELWFKEGVPSSTKHKDFVDWFNNVLLSSSGNPVHVSSVHRFKGGECSTAFILRSAKGKPDKETGECMPREIFMNKSMFDAPENAIEEACIMYVAMTRAKVQNIQLWYEKNGEEEVVQDPTRCVDCNALTDPDDHAVCIGCNRLLCNEYRPLRGPQGGLLHKGGEFDTTLSCGEFLPSADEFFDFTSTERSERNKHERYCDSCYDNTPRDSARYNRNDMYIARAINEMEHLEGFFESLKEEHDLINADLSNEPLHHDDTTIVMMLEHISKMQMNLIEAMHYARDSNGIRHELEQAGFLPANGATRVCCNCEKQAVFDVDTAIGTRSFCSEKCYAEYNGLEVMEDPNFYGMMLITRKPIETVYEVHLWTREIEGKKLGEFDEFFKFKDEESARKLYNQITDYTYKILMQYDGDEGDVLLEYDNHDPHENMGHRDSQKVYVITGRCEDYSEYRELDNYGVFSSLTLARKAMHELFKQSLKEYNYDHREDEYMQLTMKEAKTKYWQENKWNDGTVEVSFWKPDYDSMLIELTTDYLDYSFGTWAKMNNITLNDANRDSTNAYIDECPECAENTCLNNVSTTPKYHDIECYSCGYYSVQKTILIATAPYRQTKQIEGYMSEKEIEEMRANHARDSADFCNTCDAHIDLQGRDMLPRGMCIDCFIAQCREEMGIPNPIVSDNWPENDPDEEPRDSPVATEYAVLIWDEKPEDYPFLGCIDREFNVETLVEAMKIYEDLTDVFAKELHHYYQYKTHEFESSSNCLMAWDAECGCSSDAILPRDSSEFVSITLEEMDNFLVDAQGFRRLDPDEVGHYSREWVYEYYLDKNPKRKWKNCRIRIYSSIPVSYKWHEINESTDVESLSDPINADRIHHDPKGDDWVRTYDSTKSRGKGKDAIRCILLSGKANDDSVSYVYGKSGRCYRKATPTKRITNWRLNLLKKYEQWIWEEKI